jgi:tetratricopeptide (TPR) repeat protein
LSARAKPHEQKLARAGEALASHDLAGCEALLRELADLDREPPAPRRGFPVALEAKLFELATDWAMEAERYRLAMFACQRLDEAEERSGEPPLGRAFTWARLGKAAAAYGKPDSAKEAFERGREFLEEARDVRGKSRCSFFMDWGMAMYDAERYGDASDAYREALRAAESDPGVNAGVVGSVAYLYGNALLPCVTFGLGMEKTKSRFRDLVRDARKKGVDLPASVDAVAKKEPESAAEWKGELVRVLEKAVALLPPDDDSLAHARKLLAQARALGSKREPAASKTRKKKAGPARRKKRR